MAYIYPDLARRDRLVFHTVAFRPGVRRRGLVQSMITAPLVDAVFAAGYKRGIGALTKEGFGMWKASEPPTRAYAIYEMRPS